MLSSNLEVLRGAFWLTTSFAALLIALQFFVIPTFVEEFRQRIFKMRRDLFLFMVDNKGDFRSKAYVQLRSTMNGVLRFAEGISFPRLILGCLLTRRMRQEFEQRYELALQQVEDENLQKKFAQVGLQLAKEIALLSIRVSPLAWVLLPCLIVGFLAVVVGMVAIKKIASPFVAAFDFLAKCAARSFVAEASEMLDTTSVTTRRLVMADTKFLNL